MPGNAQTLGLLPGTLYFAPLGSVEPTDLVTPWDAAWVELGYTEEGSEFTVEHSMGEVMAAEEVDPIHLELDTRKVKLALVALQYTITNLVRAYNGGTVNHGSGFAVVEPPAPGVDVYRMLGHQSFDGTERHVFRKGKQAGNVAIGRKRGPNSAKLPMEYQFVAPAHNVRPWVDIMATPLRA